MLINKIKEMIEIEPDEKIYDSQITLLINAGLGYLSNNNIPVPKLDEEEAESRAKYKNDNDYDLVVFWLHFYVLLSFDRMINQTTINFIQNQMTDTLIQLKVLYYED